MTTLTDPNREVVRSWQAFWDSQEGRFKNKLNTDGSYNDEKDYVIWPVAVMVQAIIDGARLYPNELGPMVKPAVRSFDRYFNPKHGGYPASFYFDDNRDIYYDDDAQVASCFLTAYEVTRDEEYLKKGHELVDFLLTGKHPEPWGGVRWHMEKTGANTCTTAECGVAAMRLAQFVPDPKYVEFAKYCCDWIFTRVQCDDKLIGDGLADEGKRIDDAKWTYNQGTPITLASRLWAVTREDKYREWAEGLAEAATNHNTAIFDRDTGNMEARQYRDTTYFYHLLAEGLADFLLYFPDSPVASQVKDELLHTLKYFYQEMKDPKLGHYYQSFEIFHVDQRTYERFKKLTGENKGYSPEDREREHSDRPIEERQLLPSLIGCGGSARIFFQTARVHPKTDIPPTPDLG